MIREITRVNLKRFGHDNIRVPRMFTLRGTDDEVKKM